MRVVVFALGKDYVKLYSSVSVREANSVLSRLTLRFDETLSVFTFLCYRLIVGRKCVDSPVSAVMM